MLDPLRFCRRLSMHDLKPLPLPTCRLRSLLEQFGGLGTGPRVGS